MPRSVSSSSTSRYDRPKRRYQRTAKTITSGGKRKPAKADRGAGAGRGRVLMSAVSPLGHDPSQCNSPTRTLIADGPTLGVRSSSESSPASSAGTASAAWGTVSEPYGFRTAAMGHHHEMAHGGLRSLTRWQSPLGRRSGVGRSRPDAGSRSSG